MVQQQLLAPHLVASTHEQTLLLKLGDSDDGLYYQAGIRSFFSKKSFMVVMHETSLMLERLRLHGTLLVMAQLLDGTVYHAELGLLNDKNAVLTLLEVCPGSITEPRLLPLT